MVQWLPVVGLWFYGWFYGCLQTNYVLVPIQCVVESKHEFSLESSIWYQLHTSARDFPGDSQETSTLPRKPHCQLENLQYYKSGMWHISV